MSESERNIEEARPRPRKREERNDDDMREMDSMGEDSDSGRSDSRGGRGAGPGAARGSRGRGRERKFRRRFGRGKPCYFCVNKIDYVDYKIPPLLERFTTERGKIQPRRLTGVCAKHQRMVKRAINRARHLALLPYKR